VLESNPTVFNHNIETVPRLYPDVRPQADYRCSLDVLAYASCNFPPVKTKSGIMVGLGEKEDELREVFRDLAEAGVEILTVGQYLAPTAKHHPIENYYSPEDFERFQQMARDGGIPTVVSGPLVRSSYRAGLLMP
jgi:lipoic acid synthetase